MKDDAQPGNQTEAPTQAHPKRPAPSGAFKPGVYDPRRMIGRPKGLPNKVNRGARAVFEAHQHEVANELVELTKEGKADAEPCPFCKRGMLRDENVRLKAMGEVLDRGGTPRVSTLEVSDAGDTAWLEYTTAEEAQTLLTIIEACRARMPVNETREPSEDDEERVM